MKFSDLGATNSKRTHKTAKDGKHTKAYRAWYNMLHRCYDVSNHKKYPNYIGCSVDPRWLDFQNFADWFFAQEYRDSDYHLDKDLLIPGNKIYSPETCVLLPPQINTLFNNKGNDRGNLPIGVSVFRNKFQSQINIDGKSKFLGHFETAQEAYDVYKLNKEKHVKDMANRWKNKIDTRVYNQLINWSM